MKQSSTSVSVAAAPRTGYCNANGKGPISSLPSYRLGDWEILFRTLGIRAIGDAFPPIMTRGVSTPWPRGSTVLVNYECRSLLLGEANTRTRGKPNLLNR